MLSDPEARDVLRTHAAWIDAQVRRLRRKYRRLSADEIRCEVERAVVTAAGRFDASRGAFTTYARSRVDGAIVDYVRTMRGRDGRKDRCVSIDAPMPDGELRDAPADPFDALAAVENVEVWKRIYDLLAKRRPKAYLVLNLLYRERWTPAELVKYFGWSESYVSLLKHDGIRALGRSRTLRAWVMTGDVPARRYSTARLHRGSAFDVPLRPICCVVGCTSKTWRRGLCQRHFEARSSVRCACGKAVLKAGRCCACYYRDRRSRKAA